MRARITSDDRETILRILRDATGKDSVCSGSPDFSCSIGEFTVTRDGFLQAAEQTDDTLRIIEELASYGLCESQNQYDNVQRNHGPKSFDENIEICDNIESCECTENNEICEHIEKHECAERRDNNESINTNESNSTIESAEIAYPLADQSGASLLNLFCIISARQRLINKAIDARRAFFVSKELMSDLLAHPPVSVNEFALALHGRCEEYKGLELRDSDVAFAGFAGGHPDEAQIHRQLADLIMKASSEYKWAKAFTPNVRNQKYAFRIWLNSIGMTGTEYEEARRVMLSRLPGRSDRRRLQ